MTDILDRASQQEELARDACIAAVRNKAKVLTPKGECFNCLDPLGDGLLFCDEYCRDDWQLRHPHK